MRNMSFFATTEQIRNGTKTVTRRLGWDFLKPGDVVMACVKCQGLKRGEKVEKIRPIRIVGVEKTELDRITKEEVVKEGFPNLSCQEFIDMFCEMNDWQDWLPVNRIEFEYMSMG